MNAHEFVFEEPALTCLLDLVHRAARLGLKVAIHPPNPHRDHRGSFCLLEGSAASLPNTLVGLRDQIEQREKRLSEEAGR